MHETTRQNDVDRLLDFVHDRDVPCPLCHYNLRNLTVAQCPECHHDLQLTVGVTKPRFVWFLVAVTPCMFSGLAAALLLFPISMQLLSGNGLAEPAILVLDAIGWLSALGGLILVRYRFAFLRQPLNRQRGLALLVWGLHVSAFAGFLLTVLVLHLLP